MAELSYEQRYNELAQIVTNTKWTANERIGLGVIRILLHKAATNGNYALFDDLTEEKLAGLAGVSRGTAHDLYAKYRAVGLVERSKPEYTPVNRYGVPIPREAVNKDRGDRFQTFVQTAVPFELPAELPELREAPRAERARKGARVNRELANLAREMLSVECPECHKVGDWHLTCGECGATWHAAELADAQDAENPVVESFNNRDSAGKPAVQDLDGSYPAVQNLSNAADISTKRGNGGAVIVQDAPTVTEPTEPAVSPITTTPVVDELPIGPLSVYPDPLAGAETVAYLADLGVDLTQVEPRGKKALAPVDDEGDPLGKWTEYPSTQAAVLAHMQHAGGNAGMLPGRSNCYVLDVDDGTLDELIAAYPDLAMCGRIDRDNAPGSGKLLFMLEESGIRSKTYQGAKHKIEFLGLGGHAVIAGTHHTGATIRFTPFPDGVRVYKWAEIEARCKVWTGTDKPREVTPIVKRALQARPRGDLLRDAIHWWNLQPANQAAVDRLIGGKSYFAVRADDKHPSTHADHDPYTEQVKRTWQDFGTKEKLDDLEVYCRLTGTDKSTFKWAIVDEYKSAHAAR